ncbi:Rho termination factor N-terminal domain-containing protein, partial [Rhodococcus erythropolis]|nr:Rho termination factor N-terminal domain-containing protein [Rhodococcus erythropolis]
MTDTDLIATSAPAGSESGDNSQASSSASNGAVATSTKRAETRRGAGLSGMVLTELRTLAGELGIKGTSGMRKGDLIAAIKERQGGSAKAAPAQSELTLDDAPVARTRAKSTRAARTETPAAETAPAAESAPAEAAPARTESAEDSDQSAPRRGRQRRGAARRAGSPDQGELSIEQDTPSAKSDADTSKAVDTSKVAETAKAEAPAERPARTEGKSDADQAPAEQGNERPRRERNRDNQGQR